MTTNEERCEKQLTSADLDALHPRAVKNKFYGMLEEVSKKRFRFNGASHEEPDTITIITSNVRRHKDGYVMLVDNDKLIYLKDWQLGPIYCNEKEINAFAVKLKRQYFRPYTWKSGIFDDVYFEEADTYDSLLQLALEQAYKLTWKPGHYGSEIECDYLQWA